MPINLILHRCMASLSVVLAVAAAVITFVTPAGDAFAAGTGSGGGKGGGGKGGGRPPPPTNGHGHHAHHHSQLANQMLAQALTKAYTNPLDNRNRDDLQRSLDRVAAATTQFNAAAKSGDINPNDVGPMQQGLADSLKRNVEEANRLLAQKDNSVNRSGTASAGGAAGTTNISISVGNDGARGSTGAAVGTSGDTADTSVELGTQKSTKPKAGALVSGELDGSSGTTPGAPATPGLSLALNTFNGSGSGGATGAAGAIAPETDPDGDDEREGANGNAGVGGGGASGLSAAERLDSILEEHGESVRSNTVPLGDEIPSEEALEAAHRKEKLLASGKKGRFDASKRGRGGWRETLASFMGTGDDNGFQFGSPDFLLFSIPFGFLSLLAIAAYLRLKGRYLRRIYHPVPVAEEKE